MDPTLLARAEINLAAVLYCDVDKGERTGVGLEAGMTPPPPPYMHKVYEPLTHSISTSDCDGGRQQLILPGPVVALDCKVTGWQCSAPG